jgi:hypothetical protein
MPQYRKPAKALLAEYNNQKYAEFMVNTDTQLSLVELSPVPGIAASKRRTIFHKVISHDSERHIKFISKAGKLKSLVWQSSAEKMRRGVRWGVFSNTQALTSRVIAQLGAYRITSVERLSHGLVSNTYAEKEILLNLFQDRIEALQSLERLTNNDITAEDFEIKANQYLDSLHKLQSKCKELRTNPAANAQILNKVFEDIEEERARATHFFDQAKKHLNHVAKARGKYSIFSFVKEQITHQLYELQGINQDLTFSSKRSFALTRGLLNNCIEDALKEVNDYRPDLVNAITRKHQGIYSDKNGDIVAYDFSSDHLSPRQEAKILKTISFLEGWDEVVIENGKPVKIKNSTGEVPLSEVKATRWALYRNWSSFFKSIRNYFINIMVGVFFETYPQEIESWDNREFHLSSRDLLAYASPIQPLWKKPVNFIIKLSHAIKDVFYGVGDLPGDLVIRMPDKIIEDWESTKKTPARGNLINLINKEIETIATSERKILKDFLAECGTQYEENETNGITKQATTEYKLAPLVINDPLNSIGRGLNSFANLFFHGIYDMDPTAALVFTGVYSLGMSAILFPKYTSSLVGSNYINHFNQMAYSMAHSKYRAAIAGSSVQAQVAASLWDGLEHGPSGKIINGLHRLGEDPLTYGAYFIAAYSLGYVLVNGVAGHRIPGVSRLIQKDLGTIPELSYPILGAKVAILAHEVLGADNRENALPSTHPVRHVSADSTLENEKIALIVWLCKQAQHLPNVDPVKLFHLANHLDKIFTPQESASLKRILYPEKKQSIAFQIFANPLSYISAVLRIIVAFILFLYALKNRKPHPVMPLVRAFSDICNKLKNDALKIYLAIGELCYLCFNIADSFVKIFAALTLLIVGRIAGLFNGSLAHRVSKTFSAVHVFFHSILSSFYPAQYEEELATAHPNHTVKKIEESYAKLVKLSANKSYEDASEVLLNLVSDPVSTSDTSTGTLDALRQEPPKSPKL